MAEITDIAVFIASRGIAPAAFAAASGIRPTELDRVLAAPDDSDSAARIRRCARTWERRHIVSCEGWALLQEADDDLLAAPAPAGSR